MGECVKCGFWDWDEQNGIPPIDDEGCDMILHAIVAKD